MRFFPPATLALLLAFSFAAKSQADTKPAADGFLTPVTNRQTLLGSQPQLIEPLSRSTEGRDKLDLELMAKWSLNYLAGTVTPEAGYASSYGNWPLKMPPYAIGGDKISIGDSEVRNALAFVMMRSMSGIAYGAREQRGVRARILAYQLPCGLFNPPTHGDTDVLWATAWMTRALIEEYATTGNRDSLHRAERALKAMHKYAIQTNSDGLSRLWPPATLNVDGVVVHFAYRTTLDFCIVEPYVRYFEVTRDRGMLDTAHSLVEGRLRGYSVGHDSGHTHSNWHSLIGIAHLGAVLNEAKYLDWVEAQIEKWTPLMTDYGWFEATGGYGASETCAVSDLMHVCTYLGRAGRSSRYDLVERTVRNYLPHEQFFVEDATFKKLWSSQSYPDRAKQLALVRRMQGGFFCRTTPTDRWALPGAQEGPVSLEGCCPPTGMSGLYLAWKEIVRKADDGIYVNMAFNHDCAEAKVVSFLPDTGRLTVTAKMPGSYFIRIPAVVQHGQVAAYRGGKRRAQITWKGSYVAFSSVRRGEELTVTYPLSTFDQQVKRAGKLVSLHWKGNTLTAVDSDKDVWPLFSQLPGKTPEWEGKR